MSLDDLQDALNEIRCDLRGDAENPTVTDSQKNLESGTGNYFRLKIA